MVRTKTSCAVRKRRAPPEKKYTLQEHVAPTPTRVQQEEAVVDAALKRTVSDQLFRHKDLIRRAIETSKRRCLARLSQQPSGPKSPVKSKNKTPENLSGSDSDDPTKDAPPHSMFSHEDEFPNRFARLATTPQQPAAFPAGTKIIIGNLLISCTIFAPCLFLVTIFNLLIVAVDLTKEDDAVPNAPPYLIAKNSDNEVLDAGYATFAPPGCTCYQRLSMDWYNQPYRYFYRCMDTRCMIQRSLARPYNPVNSVGEVRDETTWQYKRSAS